MKLGPHLIGSTAISQRIEWAERYRPSAIKLVNSFDPVIVRRLQQCCEYVIYREVINDGQDEGTQYKRISPTSYLQHYPLDKFSQAPGIYIEVPNEQETWNGDDMRQWCKWQIEFILLAHVLGLKVVAGNQSTAHPDLSLAALMNEPDADGDSVMSLADAFGKHAYWRPDRPLGGYEDVEHACKFLQALHTNKPSFLTETGVDKSGDGKTSGWIAQFGNNEQGRGKYRYILETIQLRAAAAGYDGAVVFQEGDGNWSSFDLAPMYPLIEQIRDYPTVKIQAATVTRYSQNDARWKDKLLAKGPLTIGAAGCLVTALASIVTDKINKDFVVEQSNGVVFMDTAHSPQRPDELNQWLNDHAGFIDSLVRYAPLEGLGLHYVAAINCPNPQDTPTEKITATLATGGYVVAKVDFDPNKPGVQDHWVRVLDNWQIMDPIDGTIKSLCPRYGSDPEHAIWRVVFLR